MDVTCYLMDVDVDDGNLTTSGQWTAAHSEKGREKERRHEEA
jgi:hypothetical protein